MPLRASHGHVNTRVLNGTMSPVPPSYMFAPKIRLLLNQMHKTSNGAVADTHCSSHTASNGEVESLKGESSEPHVTKGETSDNAQTEMGKVTEVKVPPQNLPKKVAEDSKGLETQTPTATDASVLADRSPTDEDINRVWTQIRSYVQDRHRSTGCVTLPEQGLRQGGVVRGVASHVTGGGGAEVKAGAGLPSREPELGRRAAGAPKQLIQRPSNRPVRVETISGQDWKARGFSKVPTEPQFSITGGTALGGEVICHPNHTFSLYS